MSSLASNSPACPYCGGSPGAAAYPFATRWRGKLYSYRDCRGCGATFIDPLPDPAELDALFDRSAFHERFYATPEASAAQRESLAWMRRHVAAGGRLLDFGCANGAFMRAAAEAGFAVHGVEQNPGAIAFARERSGLPVSDLETLLAGAERFDIVHIADVLSHLPRPGALLRRLETLLAPGGLLVVEGPLEKQPNLVYRSLAGAARLKRLLGRGGAGEHPPLHLTFSSWKSQRRFFEREMGYRCLALDLHEDAWPFGTAAPGAGAGARAKALIGRTALALSRRPIGRKLGQFNRFRAILEPAHGASTRRDFNLG